MREGQLYFCVGLGFTTHHRLMRIVDPVARDIAATVWLSVLDYTRSNELDGHCPRSVVDQEHRRKAIDELMRVGLLTTSEKYGEHWLYLVNYSEFNDTSETIRARKERKRLQKKTERALHGRQPVASDNAATGHPRRQRVAVSETDTDTEEREREISTRLAVLSTGIGAPVESVTPLADETHRERAREQITKLAEWAKANGVER